MKSIVSILAIYFLFLAGLPCHCNAHTGESDTAEYVLSTQHTEKPDHYPFPQDCTSFCSCSNFHHSNFISDNQIAITLRIVRCEKKTFAYNNREVNTIKEPSWRPPEFYIS